MENASDVDLDINHRIDDSTQLSRIKALKKLSPTDSTVVYREDFEYLDRILNVSNNDVNSAFKVNSAYHEILSNLPEYQTCLNQKSYQPWINTLTHFLKQSKDSKTKRTSLPLKYHGLDSKNRLILSFQFTDLNLNINSIATSVFLLSIAFIEHLHEAQPNLSEKGIIMIADNKGIAFKHMRTLVSEFFIAKLFIRYLTEAASFCTKKIIIYREVPVTRSVFGLVKGYLGEEVQRVIEFCGTDLKKVVDELGGEEFCPGFLLKGKDPRKVGTEVECPSDVVLIENLVKALPKFK